MRAYPANAGNAIVGQLRERTPEPAEGKPVTAEQECGRATPCCAPGSLPVARETGLMPVEPASRTAEEMETPGAGFEPERQEAERGDEGDEACFVHCHLLFGLEADIL